METLGDAQSSGASSLGQPNAFGRHWFDAAAVALLGLGCLTGTVVLLVQGSVRGPGATSAESLLRQRVQELEQRLLEQVPPAIEQKYRDY
ncbi:hypothetical protein NZK33_04235 [Cyanobium sp. FGCU-6]|jgi:hypothetical protein|nr:hypothetical protein [Cyanobium sp. FGCU6]